MSLKNRIIGLAAVGAAALALAPVAQAKPAATSVSTGTTSSTTTLVAKQACDAPAAPVFAPWGDNALYSLVVGGDFEAATSGWSFSGGAKVVRDGDDGIVSDGIADRYALELGKGASATSPAICVATDSASYRLFANGVVAGKGAANLRVEVLFAGMVIASDDLASPIGTSVPSPTLSFVPSVVDTYLGTLTADWSAKVNIRVSSLNGATVRVDGVHMDPRMR